MTVTIRIGRLVIDAASPGEAAATVAAFRGELARLAAQGRLPAKLGPVRPLTAVTPAGRGREAAGSLAPK